MTIFTGRDVATSEPAVNAERWLGRLGRFDELRDGHLTAWAHLWERLSIEFDKHRDELRILRLHLLHLLQTVSPNSADLDVGGPARGLHGEAYPGGDEGVIEVSSGGGLVLPVVRVDGSLPRVWISGAGRYLRQAARDADTSALPALEERRIPEAALQSLIAEADAAGLLADSPDYGTPKIFDAMNTRIVVVAEGKRHDVLVRALGYPVTDLDAATVAARERVSRFIKMLENPDRIAGIGPPRAYVPAALAVFVLGTAAAPTTAPPASWPLGDLATVGTPTDWPVPSARCLLVNDAQRQAVAAAAAGVTRFAPWRSGDAVWEIAMRPLLPDEHTCADVIG